MDSIKLFNETIKYIIIMLEECKRCLEYFFFNKTLLEIQTFLHTVDILSDY